MHIFMDEWTIKTPNPICQLFFKIDLLTDIAAFCFTDFTDWRYIHSLVGIFDPACDWTVAPMDEGTILVYCCPSIFSLPSSKTKMIRFQAKSYDVVPQYWCYLSLFVYPFIVIADRYHLIDLGGLWSLSFSSLFSIFKSNYINSRSILRFKSLENANLTD
jgi:hypothetical protein